MSYFCALFFLIKNKDRFGGRRWVVWIGIWLQEINTSDYCFLSFDFNDWLRVSFINELCFADSGAWANVRPCG
jgi:hypothetical protein